MRARVKVVVMVSLEDRPDEWSSHHAGVSSDTHSARAFSEALGRRVEQAFHELGVTKVTGSWVPDLALAHGGSLEDPNKVVCKCGHTFGEHMSSTPHPCAQEHHCDAFEASKEYA